MKITRGHKPSRPLKDLLLRSSRSLFLIQTFRFCIELEVAIWKAWDFDAKRQEKLSRFRIMRSRRGRRKGSTTAVEVDFPADIRRKKLNRNKSKKEKNVFASSFQNVSIEFLFLFNFNFFLRPSLHFLEEKVEHKKSQWQLAQTFLHVTHIKSSSFSRKSFFPRLCFVRLDAQFIVTSSLTRP